jgi:hypothetical protein
MGSTTAQIAGKHLTRSASSRGPQPSTCKRLVLTWQPFVRTSTWAAAALLCVLGCAPSPGTDFRVGPVSVNIEHNRADLELEAFLLHAVCVHPDGSWAATDCFEMRIDGRVVEGGIAFPAAGQANSIDVPRIEIDHNSESGQILCLGTKVLFHGHPNERDYVIYGDPKDRYSILAFCTTERLPGLLAEQPRFAHRRASSWKEFVERLSNPIALQLAPASRNL